MLHKLPFYDEWNIEKISKAIKRCGGSYRIDIIDSRSPSVQLTASKSSIKYLLKYLLYETKGFEYWIESFVKKKCK